MRIYSPAQLREMQHPGMRGTFFRVPVYPLNRTEKDALPLAKLRPGEDAPTTLEALQSLEVKYKDPAQVFFLVEA